MQYKLLQIKAPAKCINANVKIAFLQYVAVVIALRLHGKQFISVQNKAVHMCNVKHNHYLANVIK